MADDHNQRGYRGSDAAARGMGAASGTGSSGNDPLAELARLIGQTDPFAEYGRNSAHRAASVPGAQPDAWPGEPAAYLAEQPAPLDQAAYTDQPYGNGAFGRQSYGSAALPADASELYPVDAHAPGYAPQGYEPAAYANGQAGDYDHAFPPSQEPLHDVHQHFGPASDTDYYDDVAPTRRRISVLAIAGVFALAVIGTAGALGYRAVFGPSSAPTTPPVIKADATPSKVVPASASKEPGKSTDRVNGGGQIERLLSREEQPVPVTTTPNLSSGNVAGPQGGAAGTPAMGSGVVGEPKKIRTIPIRPDQSADASAVAPAEPAPAQPSSSQPPVRVVNTAPAEPPARVTPAAAPAPEPARPAAPPPPRNVTPQAAQPANAPLSLNPNAAPARPAPAARVAAQTPAPAATSSTSGGYAVQLSSQRSEAEAQAAFQALQGRFPNQLSGRAPLIKRVDLGDKGIYYRAMVGPFGSSGEASEFCSGLKAAGGQCLIQRN